MGHGRRARALRVRRRTNGDGEPRLAVPRRPHRRRPRCRRRDGAAPGPAALGRARRRGRPSPPRALAAHPPHGVDAGLARCSSPPGQMVVRRLSSSEPEPISSSTCPLWPAGSPTCPGRWSSATTCTPTAAPTSGSPWRWTRSPSGCQDLRDDVALAFLATPTDVFAVPREAVEQATRSYEHRSGTAKLLSRPLRTVSGGRLLRRSYVRDADPGINDSLVAAAGTQLRPGQATAALARERRPRRRRHGLPQRRTAHPDSVGRQEPRSRRCLRRCPPLRHRGLRARHRQRPDGRASRARPAHRTAAPTHDHPWQDEAFGAVHGGLWRAAYAPRSALGLAALLGYGAARG